MNGYLGARQLAYNAGAAGKRPDLGTMFSLYGRGVQGGASNSQIRHAQAAREADQQSQWAHEAEVSQERFRQQQALTSQRNPNAIPSSPEELAAYLDRKRQVAAITGKTFDQQKELLDLKQRFSLQITDMNNKSRASEGDKNRLTGVYKQSVQNDFQGKENEAGRKTRVWIDSSNRASREIENNKKREFSAGQQEDRQNEGRMQTFFRSWFGASENQKKRDFQEEQTGKRQDFLSSEYDKNRAAAAARSATNLNVRITQAAARNPGNTNAKFITDRAQRAGEIELMQAHARGATPDEIDAIYAKYEAEVERSLNRR